MGKEKRRTAADWDRLVSEFEAAGGRNLVGFAKAHGVSPVRLQDRWYRIKRMRWETGEEDVRFVDVEVVSSSVASSPAAIEPDQGGLTSLEFEWSPGLRLRFPSGADVDSLARLVGAVTREVCRC